ncbi:unnamed protein product [Paramecium pentaurelia]|uniref:Uncharacterized protein n=1 Tax=Paramecium pentaurelia TaxID=43138 RepID=A0A8S1UC99_9CILI|nr:unnamed protein product [Paramecium pentaurelia]
MISLSLKQSKKQKYKSVSSDERQQIIKLFLENAYSANQIANLTGHNLSTIKAIYRIYKNEGRIYKKEKRDKQIKIKQNVIVLVVDEKTRHMNIIAKQQQKQELIIKNEEIPYLSFENTINETFLNSAGDVLKHLDSLESKQCFNQTIKKVKIQSLEIKDFQEIKENTNQVKERIKIQSQIQQFRNLFSSQELPNKQKKQPSLPKNLQLQPNSNISDLKNILEFQINDYFQKSSNDNF